MSPNERVANINPNDTTITTRVTGIKVRVIRMELFTSATLMVESIGNDYNDTVIMEINGAEYTDWAKDDNYLYQIAAKRLKYTGITKAVVPEPIK
jgi:hypothetical protein